MNELYNDNWEELNELVGSITFQLPKAKRTKYDEIATVDVKNDEFNSEEEDEQTTDIFSSDMYDEDFDYFCISFPDDEFKDQFNTLENTNTHYDFNEVEEDE